MFLAPAHIGLGFVNALQGGENSLQGVEVDEASAGKPFHHNGAAPLLQLVFGFVEKVQKGDAGDE